MIDVSPRMVEAAMEKLREINGPLLNGIADMTWGALAVEIYQAMEGQRRQDALFPPETLANIGAEGHA